MQEKIIVFPAREASLYPLPVALTPLIGRERELTELRTLLLHPEVRLLTLIGTGGVGKTRLSIELACNIQNEFADGVCFVSLAALNDFERVLPVIAQTLGQRETGELPQAQLQTYLRKQHMLLVLDNFEQVMDATPYLISLLTTCPNLHLLITSRTSLSFPGGYDYPVLPLSLPDLTQQPDEKKVVQATAVQLFVQRASMAQPAFQLTSATAPTIAAICTRLDGLPLALELAAVCVKLLSPQALLKRLEHPLSILTQEIHGLPARQQTMRRTIQWSYDLLDSWEQYLFRLCAVFAESFTLQAVESMCQALHKSEYVESGAVFQGIDTLVQKSLLQLLMLDDIEEPRLTMLEILREYGRELLIAEGELEAVRRAHATSFLQYTEAMVRQTGGMKQLTHDHENVRAALRWMIEETDEAQRVQRIEMALRLSILLEPFWKMLGYLSEGWSVMERALARSEGITPELHTQSLITAANLLALLRDYSHAEVLLEQSLALCKELRDTRSRAYCLCGLGWIAQQKGNLSRTQALYEECLALFQTVGDQRGIASLFNNMGYLAEAYGEYEQAYRLRSESLRLFRELGAVHDLAYQLSQLAILCIVRESPPVAEIHSLLDECIALAREVGDQRLVIEGSCILGGLAFVQGDLETAYPLASKGVAFYRRDGDKRELGSRLMVLGQIVTARGDYRAAEDFFTECLSLGCETNDVFTKTHCLEGMISLAVAQQQRAWAVRLCGAAEKQRELLGSPQYPFTRIIYQRMVTALHSSFSEHVFAQLWAEGRAMPPEEAFTIREKALPKEAVSAHKTTFSQRPTHKAIVYPDGLSRREVEILRYLAQGCSDVQIAQQFVISPRTVNSHLTSIYRKVHVTTRTAAARYAFDHQLV